MHMQLRRALIPLALPVLTLAASAGDLFVGPPGSGAPFTEISGALSAASAGDTIHVAAGTYDAFLVDKPVRVLGAGSASVSIQPVGAGIGVEVRDIAANSGAALSGMTLLESTGGGAAPFVIVADCDGSVVLHDLAGAGVPGGHFVSDLVSVLNSGNVVLERCSFAGEDAVSAFGGVPLLVDGSTVWVSQSSLIAGAAQLNTSASAVLNGTPGIEVVGGSTVYLASSLVRGGQAGSWLTFSGSEFPGSGGAGIFLESGAALLSGGPGNLVRGGDANPAGPSGPFGSRAGSAIVPSFAGYAEYATDVVFEGGLELDGTEGLPLAAAFDWSYLAQPYARPVLATSAAQVLPGGSLDLDYSGNAFSPVGTLVALGVGPFVALAGVDGRLAVDLFTTFLGSSTALDVDGFATSSVPVPALPALAGVVVVFQSVELAALVTALSNPALIVIGS